MTYMGTSWSSSPTVCGLSRATSGNSSMRPRLLSHCARGTTRKKGSGPKGSGPEPTPAHTGLRPVPERNDIGDGDCEGEAGVVAQGESSKGSDSIPNEDCCRSCPRIVCIERRPVDCDPGESGLENTGGRAGSVAAASFAGLKSPKAFSRPLEERRPAGRSLKRCPKGVAVLFKALPVRQSGSWARLPNPLSARLSRRPRLS